MAVALIVVLAPAAALAQAKSGKSGVYEQLNLFGEAFERIRHDAVEPVGDTKLIETAIAGMLAGLGPHSVYLNETEYKALQGQASDESAQTGLVVTHDNGQVKVVAPRDGSPAPAADIHQTMEFIRQVKVVNPATEIIMYVYTPVPLAGELYDQAKAEGFSFPETLEEWIAEESEAQAIADGPDGAPSEESGHES